MNINLLKAQIVLKGRRIKDIVDIFNISKSTIYRRLRGESNFTKQEIYMLITYFKIESNKAMIIFFDDLVS